MKFYVDFIRFEQAILSFFGKKSFDLRRNFCHGKKSTKKQVTIIDCECVMYCLFLLQKESKKLFIYC